MGKKNKADEKKQPKTKKEPVGQKPAESPPDMPGLRHRELKRDLEVGSEGEQMARSRLEAIEHARKMPVVEEGKPEEKTAVPPPDNPFLRNQLLKLDRVFGSEGRGLAKARLVALEQAHNMPIAEGGTTIAPTPGISNWVQMGPIAIPNGQTYGGARVMVTGRVTAIVVDPTNPDTIYLGAAQGGIWKTTDGGKNWIAKSDNEISLAIGALAMDPANHLILYAGTGEGNFSGDSYYGNGVLKTTDGGDSWILQGASAFAGARFCRIAVNPSAPATVFAATTYGLYRTTNGGTNWTKLTGGLPASAATDVIINPSSPSTAYAAFIGQGIYRTTNADAATPAWTKMTSGLPLSGFTRIALAVSPSSPQIIYALMADGSGDTINQFYRTTNGGTSWNSIPLPGGDIGGQGFYNINVAVDPTTPDTVYLSGISVWKAVRNPTSDSWTITDIGSNIHPDNHAFAFDPTNHQVIYAGNDGGIYRSTDGGATWNDTINEGPCITQFEFIDQHPTSDVVIIGGTQDNGTEQFCNSPVFKHRDDGDGGFVAIDQSQPRNVISTYYGPSPKRSTQGGKFGTWADVSSGLSGDALFYPPLTLDQTNQNNIAFGTDKVFLDSAQGTGGWPVSVTLPGLSGVVSALNYVNSNLIYVGTSSGQVYCLAKSGATWTARALQASPLPSRFIWDVAARPDDTNTIVVIMSGFGTAHVWRGAVPASGAAAWTDISGTGAGRLPDIPVNALAIEPAAPDTMYIATDIAVFRTTNGGTAWMQFSQGLPNVAVFDMRLHLPTRLLRVATHGRGLWERKLDAVSMPDVNIFVRDNLMDTGRFTPSPSGVNAAFEDELQHVVLGDTLWFWQCADIKIDALEGIPKAYQMNVADVDYVAFESKLKHRNPQRGKLNRVYVQLHNRGIQTASDVTVKILYADASAGLPDLPSDFWTAFPGDSADTSNWKPIGAAKVIPSLLPTEPVVLEWDWNTPATAADHSCMLVVADCASDPIPAASKVLGVGTLINNEKHVGLKNLHVVNAPPRASYWTPFQFFGSPEMRHTIRISPSTARGWNIGLLFQKNTVKDLKLKGIKSIKPTQTMLTALKAKLGSAIEKYDIAGLYAVENTAKGGTLTNLVIPKGGLRAMLLLTSPLRVTKDGSLSIVQEADKQIVGGSTFVLHTVTKRGL